MRRHRELRRQSDDSIDADRRRIRSNYAHQRKRFSQISTELDNAKAQVASLERKIKRQDALISELEAQLERGPAVAPAAVEKKKKRSPTHQRRAR